MNTKILYSFTIYFRHPRLFGACNLFNNTSSNVEQWDKSITVMASTAEEAMKELEEGYSHMEIVKVDYPGGVRKWACAENIIEHKLRVA